MNTLNELTNELEGKLSLDDLTRVLYSTDSSAYMEKPLAVCLAKNENDISKLILFAKEHNCSLIPRAAGTSLAGQVVGNGIVVDISHSFNKILEVNVKEQWVRVQPGVVRDDLNMYLAEFGLLFGPITATSNRAMLGGMLGNNSCGQNSLVYGSVRDKILEVSGFLSDASKVIFSELSDEEFLKKANEKSNSLESKIYKYTHKILSDEQVRQDIENAFPKKTIKRRNTGYAIDILANMSPFNSNGVPFNFSKIIAGSEGTLMFVTELKLSLNKLSTEKKALICVHFKDVDESLRANSVALKFSPSASELMDNYILECTKSNITQRDNRFFVKGDPGAILAIEMNAESEIILDKRCEELIHSLKTQKLGYYFPIIKGENIKKVWALRKAGMGSLSNIKGNAKPVSLVEDTAVDVEDLPQYIREFNEILKKYNLYSVHYAHAGSGELHLRPIIDLKTEDGNKLFKVLAKDVAELVKKFRGSLSGEHGDGRLRGEFIEYMVGSQVYKLLKEIKDTWDPANIFNPGKIIDCPPMNESLRFMPNIETPDIKTVFDFSKEGGIMLAVEQCNGSGDCKKTSIIAGTMCPSYQANIDERYSTRARANTLREYFRYPFKNNRFNHKEIYKILDTCLSCKGCKSECPSNVDMAKLKSEFLQNYYDANPIPLPIKVFAQFALFAKFLSNSPSFCNKIANSSFSEAITKKILKIAPKRQVPKIKTFTFAKWLKKYKFNKPTQNGKVYLFNDEFTNFIDVEIGIKSIKLLSALGYEVVVPKHFESGRSLISKGFLRKTKIIANKNVNLLADLIDDETPIVGIEPSAILVFRDEYPALVDSKLIKKSEKLAKFALLFDEFIAKEIAKGKISPDSFTKEVKNIELHGHCFQKSLASLDTAKTMLTIPENYSLNFIPSGCCGMAGAFGMEEEHYELSMKIGELVLFPHIRKLADATIIAAAGTSCRHQIKDGTLRNAMHPIEILYNALVKTDE